MIEVIVGALLLGITTLAILDGLDGAQRQGRANKERSVSATLAQQDIERLRAFPIPSLSNYRETRAVNVQGVPYTVSSRADWVRDGGRHRQLHERRGPAAVPEAHLLGQRAGERAAPRQGGQPPDASAGYVQRDGRDPGREGDRP